MKIKRNMKTFTVSAAMAVTLAACSANPVEDDTSVTLKSAQSTTTGKNKKTDAPVKSVSKEQTLNKKKTILALANKNSTTTQAVANTQRKTQVSSVNTTTKKQIARKPTQIKQVAIQAAKVSPRVLTPLERQRHAALMEQKRLQKQRQEAQIAARNNQARVVNVANRRTQNNNIQRAVYRKPVTQVRKPAVQRIDPSTSFGYALSNAAIERTKHRVRYDGSYLKIGYPWGDVPKSIGVCTDVVIRSYRKLGIDLQQEVHKDISSDFYAYPNLTKWGLTKPDPNIDHRRVYNLQAFFKRHKAELPRSRNPRDYKPGDLVTWMVGPTFPHIGVVVNKKSPSDPNRLMISHNVGAGPVIEDILFRFPMTGHYRYTPKHKNINPALYFAKTQPPASVRRKAAQNQISYAQLLQANRILNRVPAVIPEKQAAAPAQPARLYLAQLDSVLTSRSKNGLNSTAIQALLNK